MTTLEKRTIEECDRFAQFSSTSTGVTRLPFSEQNDGALAYLVRRLRELGKDVYVDAMGNVASLERGQQVLSPKTVVVSHYDSVPGGGKYDGVAGVVFGLLWLESLPASCRHQLELIAFNVEESSLFGRASLGSEFFFFGLPDAGSLLSRGDTPVSLETWMQKKKYAAYGSAPRPSYIPGTPFLEVHVEQAHSLEEQEKDVGIVRRVAGHRRLAVHFEGETGHTSLLDLDLRHDSLVAAAGSIRAARDLSAELSEQGVVGTVSVVENHPNFLNMIPGQTRILLDVRGLCTEGLETFTKRFLEYAQAFARDSAVSLRSREISRNEPAHMQPSGVEAVRVSLQSAGLHPAMMDSMAWHDIAHVSRVFPSTLLFVPNPSGKSHCPEETMDTHCFSRLLAFFTEKGGGKQ